MIRTRPSVVALVAAGLMSLTGLTGAQRPAAGPSKQLLLVLDGLRPDYVTPDVMPNLYALGQRGVVFANHHSVFPTVTRVNASSMVTGAYPERHGLMGNAVFFPQVDASRFLDTGDRANLVKINDATGGKLLTTPTLGEILQANGKKMLAVGSGTDGVAFILNYKVAGGAILHTEFALPESLYQQVVTQFGPAPPVAYPNEPRNRRAVDSFLKIGIPAVDPAITIMWISDPDTTGHRLGIGHPTTVESLRRVDAEVKRVEDGLAAARLLDTYDIWVTSDHGFATHTGAIDIQALLKPFARTLPDGSPRIVTGEGAIYVRDHDRQTVGQIVALLQKTPGVGAIFTQPDKPESLNGWAGGTLSFDVARWGHERAAEILYSPDWTDRKNEYGVAGTSASNGTAGHGSSSPFEIHNTLMAVGPDLKQRALVSTPSGNVDFAPTFLRLLGIRAPSSMQGRVLQEGLRTGSTSAASVQPLQQTAATSDGAYSQTAFFSIVRSGGATYRYLDYTKVTRR
jgi:predicted AlkP superfamily pyrophosphatase or phosphodiesterase